MELGRPEGAGGVAHQSRCQIVGFATDAQPRHRPQTKLCKLCTGTLSCCGPLTRSYPPRGSSPRCLCIAVFHRARCTLSGWYTQRCRSHWLSWPHCRESQRINTVVRPCSRREGGERRNVAVVKVAEALLATHSPRNPPRRECLAKAGRLQGSEQTGPAQEEQREGSSVVGPGTGVVLKTTQR